MKRFAWIAVMAAAGWAQQTTVVLDPAATRVDFTLGDILHTVHGTFRLKSGVIHFDPASGQAGGEMIVDARSGASGSSSRDRRMHRNILESDRYPEITFVPDRIEGPVSLAGAFTVQVHGMFTLHGTPHEVTLPVAVQFQPGGMTADLHFLIPYVSWGLKNPSNFFLRVSDKVDIAIHAVGKVEPAGS